MTCRLPRAPETYNPEYPFKGSKKKTIVKRNCRYCKAPLPESQYFYCNDHNAEKWVQHYDHFDYGVKHYTPKEWVY